jgi:hypothetical protein
MTCAPEVPRPNVNRPPDKASIVAAVWAISAGDREYTLTMPVISPIRSVEAATKPRTETWLNP